MKILIDMNLSPAWVEVLQEAGHAAVHWSQVGPANAPDEEILRWARISEYIIFTHDLDFGALLASSGGSCPSVLQVRAEDVSPSALLPLVISGLAKFEQDLKTGAIISIDKAKARARVLPLK